MTQLLRAFRFLAELQSSSSDQLGFSADTDADFLLVLIRTAVDHGLVALLGRAILNEHLLEIPEPVCANLIQAARLNQARNHQFQSEALQLMNLCRSLDLRPVLLKSTALLLAPRDDYLTDRLIGDLDILLSESEIAVLVAALKIRGFTSDVRGEIDSPLLKHYPRLLSADHMAPVEIHRELAEVAWRDVLPGVDALAHACRLPAHDSAFCLSPEDRLIHAFVHDQLDNRGWWHARVELRGAYDAVHELTHSDHAYNWQYIERQLARRQLVARFRIWLSWLAELYPLLRPQLPFALEAEAVRYARAAARGDVFWRGVLADFRAELEQLSMSSLYRQRALQRLFTPAAYRERLGRLLARMRHAAAPGA